MNIIIGTGFVIVGTAATAAIIADDGTGVGVLDDVLLPGTLGLVGKGAQMVLP